MTVTLNDIQAAAEAIDGKVSRTPLISSETLNEILGVNGQVYFKCENLQVTNSFKIRGALNAMIRLHNSSPNERVLARSSGNFAQAVSYAASQLHMDATVVMPENAPKVKQEKAKKWGAQVILHGLTHPEGYKKLAELQKENGGTILSSFDDPDVIAGQGTVGLEIIEQLPTTRSIFCPVGGGGLLAGTATAVKETSPDVQVFAAEPEGANDFALSLGKTEPVSISQVNTIADGLRAPCVGKNNWPLLQKYVDDVAVVTDDEIIHAMSLLYMHLGLIIEPSAAVSFAGLITKLPTLPEGDHVCVLSGGNVDKEAFFSWVKVDQNSAHA